MRGFKAFTKKYAINRFLQQNIIYRKAKSLNFVPTQAQAFKKLLEKSNSARYICKNLKKYNNNNNK